MRDQLNRNTLAITGTPSLVSGALTVDPDQAASFNGPTSFGSASDSTSLSITGSLSIEFFLYLSALPGVMRDVVSKSGSYAVQVNTSGNVLFVVTGPSSSVTVTSNVALSTGRWYHLVCVYNGNYSGLPQLGKATVGTTTQVIDDNNGNNKVVCKATLPETALLTSATMSLQYYDEIWPVQMRAVVYADSAGSPGQLVTMSDVVLLNQPTPQWRQATLVAFPLNPVVVPAGTYYIGFAADTQAGIPKPALAIACDSTGGNTFYTNDDVTNVDTTFGTVNFATTQVLGAYCDYTAVGRTGNEGKALIYIDGARNISATYSGGIADTANALQVCPSLAAQVDELSIWNKALSSVQIATHYTAH